DGRHQHPGPALDPRPGPLSETEDAMFGPTTLLVLALHEKILTMEAARHGFGWTALPASTYVVSVEGRFPRHHVVPRPSGLAPPAPARLRGAPYAAPAGAAPLAVAGVAVAACFIAELRPGCLRPRLPRPVHRIWHAWRHRPTVRVLVAVDVAGARYYLQRDRD